MYVNLKSFHPHLGRTAPCTKLTLYRSWALGALFPALCGPTMCTRNRQPGLSLGPSSLLLYSFPLYYLLGSMRLKTLNPQYTSFAHFPHPALPRAQLQTIPAFWAGMLVLGGREEGSFPSACSQLHLRASRDGQPPPTFS